MASSHDYFDGHSEIHEIRSGEFCDFIGDKDVAMIMFYTPSGQASRFTKDHFADAPALTNRPNTVYAAVNCETERGICFKEKAFELPEFRAYSRGMLLGNYDYIYTMTGERLAKYVEDIPIPIDSSTPAPYRKRY